MSFAVKVRRVVVSPHPDPETIALECGQVDGYAVVIRKGEFATGDLAVYIPEGAIVPDPILEELGLTGRLAGKEKNRVKAIRLRGQLSQGLLYRPDPFLPWQEGDDVAEELGIAKYEPPIPLHMQGVMERCPSDFIRSYDLEDIKKYPDILQVGEQVVMTEKLHGSQLSVGCDGETTWVSSKGLADRGLCLVEDAQNVYWRAARDLDLINKVRRISDHLHGEPTILFGEVLGVQDLMYGLKKGRLEYRAFDLYTSTRGFLDHRDFTTCCEGCAIPTVPTLYEGPFSPEVLAQHTSGQSTMAQHLREGVVVQAEPKRFDPQIGRVILKSVSAEYLLRKGDTTELQ